MFLKKWCVSHRWNFSSQHNLSCHSQADVNPTVLGQPWIWARDWARSCSVTPWGSSPLASVRGPRDRRGVMLSVCRHSVHHNQCPSGVSAIFLAMGSSEWRRRLRCWAHAIAKVPVSHFSGTERLTPHVQARFQLQHSYCAYLNLPRSFDLIQYRSFGALNGTVQRCCPRCWTSAPLQKLLSFACERRDYFLFFSFKGN